MRLVKKKYFKVNGGILMKITKDMVHKSYLYAKKVYKNDITRSEGKIEITRATGMNSGSAGDYITAFLAMMSGDEYRRTINTYATDYYLQNIKVDFGQEAFIKALSAVEQHVRYYNKLGRGNLKSIQDVVKEYKELL